MEKTLGDLNESDVEKIKGLMKILKENGYTNKQAIDVIKNVGEITIGLFKKWFDESNVMEE